MNPFQRSIISGLLVTATAAALTYTAIAGASVPWPIWLAWLGIVVGWYSYGARCSAAESRLRRQQYVDALIAVAFSRASLSVSVPAQGRDHD